MEQDIRWSSVTDLLLCQSLAINSKIDFQSVLEKLDANPLYNKVKAQDPDASNLRIKFDELSSKIGEIWISKDNNLPSKLPRLLKKICEQAYSKYRENLISAIRNKEVEYHSLKVQIGDGISEDVLFAKEPKHEALEDDMRERGHIKGAEINLNSDRYRVSADDSKPDSPSSTSPPLSAEVSNSALGRKPSKLSRRFREQAPDTNEGPDVPSTTKRARKEDSTDNQSIVPRLGRPRKKARRFEAQESESNEEVDSTPTPTTSVASIPAESMSKKLIQQLIPALENIIQHKHGAIFTQPISARDAPNYDSFVYKPQDFRTLKNQLKNGEIQNTAEFYREILRIFANAIMYNREGSAVAQWAGSCFYFTEEILKDYRALEWLSTSSSEALGDKHHPGIKRKKY